MSPPARRTPRPPVGRFLVAVLVLLSLRAHAQEELPLDGEHVRVRSAHISGAHAYTEAELFTHLQTQPPPSLITRIITFGTVPVPYVVGTALTQDCGALADFYRDNGFLFATVANTIAIDTPARAADVLFTVEEGRRCTVSTIVVDDSGALPPPEHANVQATIGACTGAAYSTMRLRDSVYAALDYLQNIGYRFAHVGAPPTVRLNRDLATVTVTVPVVPGRRYRFGRITIVYDSASRDICFAQNAVEFEYEFQEGELYSRAKAARTEDNLRRLGVFDHVGVVLMTGEADSNGVAPVEVRLGLRKQFDITPAIDANNNLGTFNLGASITFAHHNVFCAAQELSLNTSYEVPQLDFSASRVDLTLRFVQPRVRLGTLLDYRNTSLLFTGGYNRTTFPFKRTSATLAATLNIRQATYTYLVPGITFVQVQVDTTVRAQPGAADSSVVRTAKSPNLILSLALTRDNTDNLFVPTRGSAGVLTLKTNVLNTPYFAKVEASQRWYVAWGTQSVFAFRLRGGLIGRFGNVAQDVITDEKFAVGGAYSVRGWGLYELGIGVDSPRTGYAMFEANLEWRYQWFQLPESWITRVILNRLSHDFFIDMGQVWSDRRLWTWVGDMPRQVAVAIGAGLRYDTPVGPVRLDLGYRLYDPATRAFPHVASFDGKYPFIHLVHPQLQLAIGNAF